MVAPSRVAAAPFLPARGQVAPDAALELVGGVLQAVVGHDVGELPLRAQLLARGGEPRGDLRGVVRAPADQPGAQRLVARRSDEDLDGLVHRLADLARALDL